MPYDASASSDFYSLLEVPRDASPTDIKIAYHRTLLRLHPDKQSPKRRCSITATTSTAGPSRGETSVDVALLKEAYRTLSNVASRAVYDGALRRKEHAQSHAPRPAQIVSLDEFTTMTETSTVEAGSADAALEWWYRCRCGGTYRITQHDLENGTHLVGCESCSEVIWVGYEEAVVTEDEGVSDTANARFDYSEL